MERRKTLTKEGIYEAAVAVLVRDGVETPTMERVAEEAGVATGSVYNYFENKLKLLEFVYERTIAPLKDGADAVLDSEGTAAEKLHAFVIAFLSYLNTRRGLFHFLFTEHAIHKLIGASAADGSRRLAEIIRQGIGEGAFRPVDSEFYGTLLFGGLRQMLEEQMGNNRRWAIEDMAQTIVTFYLHGLTRPGGAPE
ncbi:MAG: TetR/AcrR family transcriptional regulator [Patescibacteria group bacterium]|nr:TetR/AcrR family transcriptional regulator [Patescibacteria group bacterium]